MLKQHEYFFFFFKKWYKITSNVGLELAVPTWPIIIRRVIIKLAIILHEAHKEELYNKKEQRSISYTKITITGQDIERVKEWQESYVVMCYLSVMLADYYLY